MSVLIIFSSTAAPAMKAEPQMNTERRD